jgi:cbb3-type cytochrome oxidase maturation protein
MSISYLLVVLGLAAFAGAVWALFWAVDAGQYDDLEAQGAAILDESAAPMSADPADDGSDVEAPDRRAGVNTPGGQGKLLR